MNGDFGGAAWLGWPETQAVMAALEAVRPGASRFVGGCVRDTLLGRPVTDIDVATQLLPDMVIEAAEAAGLTAHPTGLAHGTVTLVSRRRPFEVTTLRRDVATDGRRAVVAFTEDWAEDAARRDFRLNAIYAEPDGVLHDPTGGGIADAEARRIAFIGDPAARIREDYLRILRFFRFFAWYGNGEPDAAGLAACAALKDGLARLSAERIWKELKKLLAAPDPLPAVRRMHESGILAVLAPEAMRLERLKALLPFETEGDSLLRLAALLPDEPEGAETLATRLRLANEERERLVGAARPAEIEPGMSTASLRRLLYLRGRRGATDRLLLARAKENGEPAAWEELFSAAIAWRPPPLPVSGADIVAAGVPPGPKVGAVLRAVEDWWIDSDFSNDSAAIQAQTKMAIASVLNDPG